MYQSPFMEQNSLPVSRLTVLVDAHAPARAGLEIPEREKAEIAAAAHFVEEMAERVRSKRAMGAEPAHIFPPPGV